MQRADRKFGIGRVDQQRELDFRRGDGTDVDPAFGQRPESLRGDARVTAHADADHGNLRDVVRTVEAFEADRLLGLDQHRLGAVEIRRRYGEGEVGGRAVGRNDLYDHIYVDVGLGERAEDGGRNSRPVGDAADRYLRLVLGEGDAGHDMLFHDLLLVADEGAGRDAVRVDVLGLVEARAHEDAHVMDHTEFD